MLNCRSIAEERTDSAYRVSCGMVEIYNEVVHDLLADKGKREVELQRVVGGFNIPELTQLGMFAF